MQVQVNTDNHTAGSAELTQAVQASVEKKLRHFSDRLTRVEAFLTDENSEKKTRQNDIRCVMEARLTGLQPITVSADASSSEQAIDGAADKLEKALRRTLERLDTRKGRSSYAGDSP